MRVIILVSIFSSLAIMSFSQSIITEYFSNDWQKVDDNGCYKRQITQVNDSLYEVKDYIKGKRLEMVGYFKSIMPEIEHGTFEFYDKKGQVIKKETYHNGELMCSLTLNSKGKEHNLKLDYDFKYETEETNEPLENHAFLAPVNPTMRDSMPNFKGGEVELSRYIGTKILYPSLAYKYGIQGTVLLKFLVSDEGKVYDVKVVKSAYKDLDKEAIRLMRNCPDWIAPKIKDGKPISVTLPINFVLY